MKMKLKDVMAAWFINRFARKYFQRATIQDVYYCYRLFLNREPDEGGLAHWSNLVRTHRVPISFLTDSFANGREFLALQKERNQPHLVETELFDIYVRLNDYFIGAGLARDKTHEPHVTAAIKNHLKVGMRFVDIGANIGYFTLLAAALVEQAGSVYAFEPGASNVALLRQSIAKNGFDNITLYPVAVGETARQTALEIGGVNSNGRIVPADMDEFARPIVDVVALDDTLDIDERIDLVKMDIEGAEPLAIAGMRQLIRRHRPTIITEFAPDLIPDTSHVTPREFLETLVDLGYELRVLPGNEKQKDLNNKAMNIEQVLAAAQRSGGTHLDLLLMPKAT